MNILILGLQFIRAVTSPTLSRAGPNPGHFSSREDQDSMFLLLPTPHNAQLGPTSSLRPLLSPDPISRVWAYTSSSETFSVEALKSQDLRDFGGSCSGVPWEAI